MPNTTSLRRQRIVTVTVATVMVGCGQTGATDEATNTADEATTASMDDTIGVGESTNAQSDGPVDTTADPGSSSGSESSAGTTGGGIGPASSCSEAVMIGGAYEWDGNGTPDPAGVPLFGEPPVDWGLLVMTGTLVYTNTVKEVWLTDLGDAEPVTRRIIGAQPDETDDGVDWFRDGPCNDARFLQIDSIALLPTGELLIADSYANAIVRVTSPSTADCAVEYFAGTQVDLENPGAGAPSGDSDGPAATALFSQPKFVTTGPDGAVYFIDGFNTKLRKIDADAEQTVSTLFDYESDQGFGPFHVLGDTLYARHLGEFETIETVDRTTGERQVLASSANEWPGLDANNPTVQGFADDGEGLLMFGLGYIWYMTPAGELSLIAGNGEGGFEFPVGFDPTVAIAALEYPFLYGSTMTGFAYSEGKAYIRGQRGNFQSPTLLFEVSCP